MGAPDEGWPLVEVKQEQKASEEAIQEVLAAARLGSASPARGEGSAEGSQLGSPSTGADPPAAGDGGAAGARGAGDGPAAGGGGAGDGPPKPGGSSDSGASWLNAGHAPSNATPSAAYRTERRRGNDMPAPLVRQHFIGDRLLHRLRRHLRVHERQADEHGDDAV